MADLETLTTRLSEAETALHALNTGQRVVEVWRDGKRVTYQSSNKGDLVDYIAFLNAAIADLSPATTLPRRRFIPVSLG